MKLSITAILIGLASLSHAKPTYHCNGTQVTKGEDVQLLVTGKANECIETKAVVFNMKTGSLSAVKGK